MSFQVALVQMSFDVHSLSSNADKIIKAIKQAKKLGADLVVFPELCVTGYPPEDLLLREDYRESIMQTIDDIVLKAPTSINVIIGTPYIEEGRLFNSAIHIVHGQVAHIYHKIKLPNYQVFDEKRYFAEGDRNCVFELLGYRVGLTICEDMWNAALIQEVKQDGAECIININASPFDISKQEIRQNILKARSQDTGIPLIYVNTVGAQDELVFDGNSTVVSGDGTIVYQAPSFEESLGLCEVFSASKAVVKPQYESMELIHCALLTGLKTYVDRTPFSQLVVGISGGIDSAVSAVLAVSAVGSKNVKGVMMPSQYTSAMSIEDAQKLAHALNIELLNLPITDTFEQLKLQITTVLNSELNQLTNENLQARIRACILMGVSNQYHSMVVSTSNKSEIAVGYTTLYGDMIGGYAPLKDLYKTQIYALADYYNRTTEVIPQNIIKRAPSAELSTNQKDSDSLPPYELLDQILKQIIEYDASPRSLIEKGFPENIVNNVCGLVEKSEYKRRQSIPGVKISPRAFGKDRRYPLNYRLDSK